MVLEGVFFQACEVLVGESFVFDVFIKILLVNDDFRVKVMFLQKEALWLCEKHQSENDMKSSKILVRESCIFE